MAILRLALFLLNPLVILRPAVLAYHQAFHFLTVGTPIWPSRFFIIRNRFGSFGRSLLISLLLLPACAPNLYWAKPGAAEGEFEQELRTCRELLINEVQYSETSLNPLSRGITDEALAKCMNSRGWFLAEKP